MGGGYQLWTDSTNRTRYSKSKVMFVVHTASDECAAILRPDPCEPKRRKRQQQSVEFYRPQQGGETSWFLCKQKTENQGIS